jgi:hypothetical protein
MARRSSSAARLPNRRVAKRHNAAMPRFWIAMQIVIIICVIISAVIVVVKL